MRVVLVSLVAVLPVAARPFGGHDAVGCAGCHSAHAAKGAVLSAQRPNATSRDPRTGEAGQPISALCLSCHADREEGGRGVAPVSGHLRHPFSRATVNRKLASVPPELLRDGRFECVACHDPHPSNPNYRYLRIAVTRSPSLSELCGVCHPRKANPSPRAAPPSTVDGPPRAPDAAR